MKLTKIECVIEPYKLEKIKKALTPFGLSGLTISEVKGFSHKGSHQEIYRAAAIKVDFVPKLVLAMFIASDRVEEVIQFLRNTARTGTIGEGEIFISPIESMVRFGADEKDAVALPHGGKPIADSNNN